MNIKKTTKYSLLAIGVLTTFQLGQVKASADSFENSNESLIKNQDENQPALNTTVSIPESETRAVTEPNPEEKPAVDQGDKKYPAPALTEKETKSSEEDAKNTSTEASSSDKDSKAETTLNKDSEGEASPGKDSKTDPTLNSVEKKEDPTLAPDKLSNASTNEAETAATPAPKIRRKRAAASNTKVYEDADYGKYVKATDFGLDTTGKVEASEAIKKALSAANEVEGGASVMLSGTVLLKNTLVIDENYANVKGLIGSGPSRNNTKILFNKKQDGEHDPETNLTDNRYESAVLIQNQKDFTVGRLTVEHAYDSSDYTKDNEFYRKGKSYFGRSNGIYVNDSSNVTINDVRAMKFNRAGVFFSSSKATAQEYDSNGRPIRYSSISEKVSNEVKSIGDPDVPIMDGNKVTNSFLHNNRVAGVMFGYQRNFVVDNNII